MNWWRAIVDLKDAWYDHEKRIRHLEREERRIVTQLDDIKATVQGLVAEDSIVIAAIADLKAKADAGQTVTAQDLTDLQTSLQSEVTRLTDAVTANDPDVQNPPAPPDNPPTNAPGPDAPPVSV